MKVAVISFIFPIAEPYYRETLKSIYNQSDQDFDTIIVDDGLGVKDLPDHIRHIQNDDGFNLIKLREAIFNQMVNEGYDLLISIDSDDIMSDDRVAKTKEAYLKSPEAGFYYSKLHYLANPGKEFFCLPKNVTDIDQILFHNFVGLSHTSLNLRVIRERKLSFIFPSNIVALDWFLVTWYLFHGFKGCRSGGVVYYRLYKDNIAGETAKATFEEINRIINIKIKHYNSILTLYNQYSQKVTIDAEISRLKKIQLLPKKELVEYINNNTKNLNNNFWWAGY